MIDHECDFCGSAMKIEPEEYFNTCVLTCKECLDESLSEAFYELKKEKERKKLLQVVKDY